MTERAFDAERFAAMLDGRLDAAEREEFLKELDESPELREMLADAAAVLGQLEAEDAALAAQHAEAQSAVPTPATASENDAPTTSPADVNGVTSPARAPSVTASSDARAPGDGEGPSGQGASPVIDLDRARQRKGIPRRAIWSLAAAAVVAGIVVAPALSKLRGSDGDPGAFASIGTFAAAGPPAQWDRTPWSPTRSGGDEQLPSAVRAVRLGAAITDAEVAARTSDPSLPEVAGDVQRLLAPIAAAGAVSRYYDDIAAGGVSGPAAEDRLRDGRRAIVRLPDAESVRDGAWLEAARMAAARRDADFFATGDSRDRARRIASAAAVPAAAQGALSRIARGDAPGDWAALDASLTEALRALGGG